AVPEHAAASATERIPSRDARTAMPAPDERLDRDPIADVDAPPLRRTVADLLDHAERLVPGNEREPDREHARVLLGVASADPARLDAEEPAVRVDVGNREVPKLERARPGLHDGARGATRRHA